MKKTDVIDEITANLNKSLKRIDWLFDMMDQYRLANLGPNEPFEINGVKYVVLEIRYFDELPDIMLGFWNKEGVYQDNITNLSYVTGH